MRKLVTYLSLSALLLGAADASAQFKKKKDKDKKNAPVATIPGAPDKDKGPKPYKTIITSKAISRKGLMDVHHVDEKWYFEIQDSLIGREIMAVTRYVRTAAGGGVYGGEEVNRQVLKWEKGINNKLFLRSITYVVASEDSTKPMFRAIRNSNADPIIAVFDIKSIRKDTSLLIDVSDFFNSDNHSFSLDPFDKQRLRLTMFQKDKSFISRINTYPMNTEIKTVKTFEVAPATNTMMPGVIIPAGMNTGFVTFDLNTSMILLPKVPMRVRHYDQRVGFFTNEVSVFEEESQKAEHSAYAIRWRLEPKNAADAEKQKRGELIEPKKPIVYYIDPATPVKWRKYLKAGVDDWNAAYEQAGWKNAIRGEYWPEKDTTMSLEDARYSVIRYFASDIMNAYGPNVNDPRSGEILESHVGWYHNVMKLLHNWYMIQAGATDPRAQKKDFDDELMGQLIRFVSSHEIGHTLGLRHNMGASHATPVEKLRDKDWVAKNGHTSSIMDYARFNYVAQPEDGVTDLFPRIGDYDKWAIKWGYTYFPDAKSADEEKALLHKMTLEAYKNERLWFGTEVSPCDPRYQTEDLSDNAMKASEYGIKNLQRILPKLLEWTKSEGESYIELEGVYTNLVQQFSRYNGHVIKYVGGIYDSPKTYDMAGNVYEVVPAALQRSAMEYLNKHVFQTPTWLLDQTILSKIKPESGVELIKNVQGMALANLLSADRLVRLVETGSASKENYSVNELVSGLRKSIFSDLKGGGSVDVFRRDLQKMYVSKLIGLLKQETAMVMSIPPGARYNMSFSQVNLQTSDVHSVVRGNLEVLKNELKSASALMSDELSRFHAQDLYAKIEQALDPK